MDGAQGGGRSGPRVTQPKVCSRRGCDALVKKPTAKYCSVRCCAIDPERHARLRISAQRSTRRVLPMSRQLHLDLPTVADAEAQIALLSEGREDVPVGMSRFCG